MATLKITSAKELTVHSPGGSFLIHPIWLRERCQDAKSLDRQSGQRLHDPSDLPLTLSLTAVSEPRPDFYRIRFSDGHEAEFSGAEILREFALPPGDFDCPLAGAIPRAAAARVGQRVPAPRLHHFAERAHYSRIGAEDCQLLWLHARNEFWRLV